MPNLEDAPSLRISASVPLFPGLAEDADGERAEVSYPCWTTLARGVPLTCALQPTPLAKQKNNLYITATQRVESTADGR